VKLKKYIMLIFNMLLIITFSALTLSSSSTSFKAGMDAYVISGSVADNNYGTAPYLYVGKYDSGSEIREIRAYIYFPLTSLSTNAIITKAYLRLRLNNKFQFSAGEIKNFYVYMVSQSWSETTVTWNNKPATDRYVNIFTIKDTTTVPRYLYITVTDAVKKWYGQGGTHPNYGLAILGENKPGYIQFYSREYTGGDAYKPTLIIYYTLLTASVSPTTASVKQGESAAFQVEVKAPGYSGTASLSVTGLPSGAVYSFTPNSGTPPFNSVLTIATSSSTPPGTYNVYVVAESEEGVKYKKKITLTVKSAGDFSLSFNPPTITVPQGGSGSSTLVASFSGGFTGPITLTVQSKPAGFTVNIAPSGSTATVTVNVAPTVAPGSYNVVIKGTGGGKTHTATLTVQVQSTGFSLAFNPPTLTIKQGESASSSLSIAPIGGFTQDVTLSVESAPSGLDVDINPSTASPGSSVTVTVTVDQSVAPGSYNVVIKGEGGGKSATATLSVTVEEQPFNFNLQASPSSLSVDAGEEATITVTATLASGSPQELTLTLSGLPSGASYSFSPPTITPTGSSTLTIDTAGLEGSYSLVITASGGGVAKQAAVSLKVKKFDFTVAANPTSVEISQGESATIAITVTKTSGAAKKVKLSLLGLPGGASYSFSPEELEPTGTSILTINAGSAKGTYTLIIRATADGKEKTATVTLKIKEKRCIIATVTYGSEVSREVNFLRGFRDRIVLASYAGQRFYAAFDAFYYSWSPAAAQYILEHPWLKPPIKALLYPLLGALLVASYAAMPVVHLNPEAGVYLAGTIASALIGIFYVAPLGLVLMYLFRKWKSKVGGNVFRAVAVFPLLFLVFSLLLQALSCDLALSIATSAYVVSLIAAVGLISIRLLDRLLHR